MMKVVFPLHVVVAVSLALISAIHCGYGSPKLAFAYGCFAIGYLPLGML